MPNAKTKKLLELIDLINNMPPYGTPAAEAQLVKIESEMEKLDNE